MVDNGAMIPVFAPDEVRQAERRAVAAVEAAGEPDALMTRAARALADAAQSLSDPTATVTALAGGGDNGGDALYAASYLAEAGHDVRAAVFSDHPHTRALAAARSAGVEVLRGPVLGPDTDLARLVADLWIDGITGSGLRGALREPLASAVARLDDLAQTFDITVVAADVPTGIAADGGRVEGPVLRATHTVSMGALTAPLALPPAAALAGSVEVADLGFTPEGAPLAWRVEDTDVADAVRVPGPLDHKYTRGVVAIVAGSDTYPGAGVLATAGALACGPGMVRLLTGGRTSRTVLERHPAVVTAYGRSQSAVIGSGLDAGVEPLARAGAARALTRGIPLVIDAGALGFVPDLLRHHGPLALAVLTPHAGEAATLIDDLEGTEVLRSQVEAAPLDAARRIGRLTGATVVLKGSTTLVAAPDGRAFSVRGESAWAGVAGAGDVLAGMLGALLAQDQAHADRTGATVDIAATCAHGVWMHARAAARASGAPAGPGSWTWSPSQGFPVEAPAIARAVPTVIQELLEVRREGARRRRRAAWRRAGESPSSPPSPEERQGT